ncbi:hypothetical protein C8A01DRAFT_31529 [Parachaetomium inaequale]|uniref:Uncharacterized protein n=1 Tax=Parachaetomium inaequale TaxID=2588326 RepID=A0AAN6PNH7_9PEZI|nr:hypothetical protein C8A01DRAFT_31529 [Parachaetomium inaequale]
MDGSTNTFPSSAACQDPSRGNKRTLADCDLSSASSPPPAKHRVCAYTIFRSSSLPAAKRAQTDPAAAEMEQTELPGAPQSSQESPAASGATRTTGGPVATTTTTTVGVPGASPGHQHSPAVASNTSGTASGPAMTSTTTTTTMAVPGASPGHQHSPVGPSTVITAAGPAVANTNTTTTTTSGLPPSPDLITPPKSTSTTPEKQQTQKQQLPQRPPRLNPLYRHSLQHQLCGLYAPTQTPRVVMRDTPHDVQHREIEALLFDCAAKQLAFENEHLPNGSALPLPPFRRDRRLFPDRPVAWIKDWDTGWVRPRRMMDDFREVKEEKKKREEEMKGGEESEEESEDEEEEEDEKKEWTRGSEVQAAGRRG